MGVPVFISDGLGIDSTALLANLLGMSDAERGFPLSDLVVATAMTGDEFRRTGELNDQFKLPLLRRHGVRYIQVSRAGQSESDGIAVLDDSTSPQRMVMRGPWSLRDELRASGTVPQLGGARKCSYRAKGCLLYTSDAADEL